MSLTGAGFVAFIAPSHERGDEAALATQFRRETGREPDLVLTTPSSRALVAGPGTASLSTDPSGQVSALVHGDLWGRNGGSASELARMYLGHGDSFARDVRGAWAGMIVDPLRDRVLFYTDRLNSRRLLHRRTRQGHWVATDLEMMPTRGVRPDPVGVAWYLSNGVVHCGRTILEGISVLDSASVHEVRDDTLVSNRHWRYPYGRKGELTDETSAGEELVGVIRSAVDRCSPSDGPVWLSLSGGYDSVAIAGALGELPDRDVRCLSYAHGIPAESSDAAVARNAAGLLGLPHRLLESYEGDFLTHVARNASMGEGMANACDEVDAWVKVGESESGPTPPVMLVGDHFLPANPDRRNWKIPRPPPGKLWGPEVVRWLTVRLNPTLAQAFYEGIPRDLARVSAEVEHTGGRIRSLLFFEQRLPNMLLSWRHMFAGRYFQVRNPLLDNDVLDFTASVSSDIRGGRYYHDAVTRAFPHLFREPRARTHGYYVHLNHEIAKNARAIRRQIRKADSPLDWLIPTPVAMWMLGRVAGSRRWTRRLAVRLGMKQRRGSSRRDDSFDSSRRFGEPMVFRRYLILREALKRADR